MVVIDLVICGANVASPARKLVNASAIPNANVGRIFITSKAIVSIVFLNIAAEV